MVVRSSSKAVALVLAATLAVTLLILTVVWTPWDPLPGATITTPPYQVYFTPAQVARSNAYFDAARWPAWLGLVVHLCLAVAVAFTPVGRRLVAAVRRRSGRRWVQTIVLTVVVVVLDRLVTLPTAAWSEAVARRYGLSTQAWRGWLSDVATSLGLNLVLIAAVVLAVVLLARRFPRAWFVPAAAGATALTFAISFAYPVVVEPLFNTFTPLPEGPLRTQILKLADASQVSVSDVLIADASVRTTSLNAYVSGFGSTRRIVIYDTLLTSASNREIELIVAHELGHASTDDVLIGTIEASVGAALAVVVLYLLLLPGWIRRPVGAGSAGDPAVVPLLLGLVALVAFLVLPLQNTISRQMEARADAHSLNVTRDPNGFIRLQQQLALTNLTHLDPVPVLQFWFGTHPTTMQRIGMAEAWLRLKEQPS